MEKIKEFEELAGLLSRAYWIEKELEDKSLWRAYISQMSEENRKIILSIAKDSMRHRKILEEIGERIGIDLGDLVKDFEKISSEFSHLEEGGIFKHIFHNEMLAKEIYSAIKNTDEERHIKLVEPLVDTTKRIL
ncbi:MAG: hypothetical protein PWR09_1125 [Archaeoglobi archaeon]|nr:hypothetical protein [Archaeoglobi archaeon]